MVHPDEDQDRFLEKSILCTALFVMIVSFAWMRLSRESEAGAGARSAAEVGSRAAPRSVPLTPTPLQDFALKDDAGRLWRISELTAGRRSLLYFYSGCCGHCSRQLPRVSRFIRRLQDENVVIVGVEYLGTSETCARSRTEHGLVGTILADPGGEVCRALGVGDLTVFAVDERSLVRYRGGPDRLESAERALGIAAGSFDAAKANP